MQTAGVVPVRVYMRVPGTQPMEQLMRLVQDIEAAGFDGVGILDSQLLSRDTFVVLAQAATSTSRLTLFPAVTNPLTRHASVLAGAIQSVEELAPGRVKFVMGTGYTSAGTIGRRAATRAEMRECLRTVRALLAGESVDFGGTPGRLTFAARRPIPLIMAASGPKAIERAGEMADGCSLGRAAVGRVLAGAGGHPAAEARDSGGGPHDLSRSVARTGLGGGDRRHVVRLRRGRRAAVRCARIDRGAGGLRGADRGDGEARREEPLSDADADLRASGAGDRRIPRRGVPTAPGGWAQMSV